MKLDPLAYILVCGVLAIQVYTSFLRGEDVEAAIAESDRPYKTAVFDSSKNKGVMHRIFRPNETDRELLKTVLLACGK